MEEETVYDEVKMETNGTEQTPDPNAGLLPHKKASRCHHCQWLACCLGTFCAILVLGIIAASVYYLYNKFILDAEDSRRNQTNSEIQFYNPTQASTVLGKQVTTQTEENEILRQKNKELEAEKKNLTEQIQLMKTSWKEPNVSQAQWSIDAYCPKENNSRQCTACQKGWLTFQSSCYANTSELKTWEEAREDCRRKGSDLVVVVNADEKQYVRDWESSGKEGYWIGLRAEDGKWKWVDGSDLMYNFWIQQSPSDGFCAVSVQNQGFKSVRCNQKKRWICKKKSLSV